MPASHFMQMYEESRGLDLCGIRETSETRVVGIFKKRLTGFWIDIGMIVGKRSPHEIQGLYLLPSGPPPGTPPLHELSDKEIAHELDEYLDRLAEAEVFSGTAILEKEGEILLSKACGRAHRGLDIPNRIGTRYNIASMGKMFTAVAIAQLVERGKLSYEDRINKFLGSDWISRKTGERVRIQHLLTHTSGMGDYLPRLSKAPVSGFGTLEDFKSLCNRESPRFEPGTDWAYSNTGFLLLGAVIQEVSGKDYYEYIEENIFRPAGMTDTGFLTITEKMERPGQDFALSYFREYTDKDTTWRSGMSDSAFRIRGSPAGGAFSTAGDIQKFARALRSNSLISESSGALLMEAKPDLGSPRYGYGFNVNSKNGERIVGHRGGHQGVSTLLQMYLDRGYTVVILSNSSSGAFLVNNRIQELLSSEYYSIKIER